MQYFAPDIRASIPTFILEKIIAAMSSSITTVFLLALIPIIVSFMAILFMGNVKAGTKDNKVNSIHKFYKTKDSLLIFSLYYWYRLLRSGEL